MTGDCDAVLRFRRNLDKQRIDLRDVVTQAVDVAMPSVERRKQTLKLDVPDAAMHADADRARLVQVTGNLLNNAAKYSPANGHIDLVLRRDGDTGLLSVPDSGIGLPPEMLGRVFQRFVQIDAAEGRSESGLGIGLSVVKALVELHGGTVDAYSAGIGQGSTFTFRVPLAQ